MKREDIEKAAAIYTAQAEDSDYAEVKRRKTGFCQWCRMDGKTQYYRREPDPGHTKLYGGSDHWN